MNEGCNPASLSRVCPSTHYSSSHDEPVFFEEIHPVVAVVVTGDDIQVRGDRGIDHLFIDSGTAAYPLRAHPTMDPPFAKNPTWRHFKNDEPVEKVSPHDFDLR